jgi:2-dehydropantoate 2-reductase
LEKRAAKRARGQVGQTPDLMCQFYNRTSDRRAIYPGDKLMRIAIMGTGGIGGYFGGRLAAAGEEVIFIARGAQLRALQTDGLHLALLDGGTVTINPASATDDPASVGAVDLVLVAVKAWQVPDAAQAIRPMIGPETVVLPLENGVEASDQIAAVIGPRPVLAGLCHISAFVESPGHIRHAGIDPVITFGELDNSRTPRVQRLKETLEHAGVRAVIADDIQVALWTKFLFIAAVSGVGAVARAPIGVTRSCPETRALLRQAMDEIHALAVARGVKLPADAVSQTLSWIDKMPPAVTASMHRDIVEGRPSELEAQNGAIVRLGAAAGVDVPAHRFIYASLLPSEMKARG